MTEVPERCERDCIMILEELCEACATHYTYWCEVDDSEMDIDWSEYADITTSEWETDGERTGLGEAPKGD